jgi:endo-1,4-beta-xylanase
MKYKLCILLLLICFLSSCALPWQSAGQHAVPTTTPRPFTGVVTPLPTPVPPTTLRAAAQRRGILIGAAVGVNQLETDPMYAITLARQFDEVTPENAMKFDALEPSPGEYTFVGGDAIVAFARAHGMAVRGHNLVWYRSLPGWLANGTFSRAQLMAILKDYIMTVVSHYRGRLVDWDVVNEAIADGSNTLRDSIWMQDIGSDYIDWAFRWAHQADPQAHLFYNDYGGEGLGAKSDAIYNLVKGLVKRGVPIYGVGLQMHVSITDPPSEQAVIANMKRLAALGLKVEITEMDVEIQGDPRPLAQKLQAQAQLYRNMIEACLAVSACNAFVMWGFTDRYSWIPEATGHADAPLIFDQNYRPKPAFDALMNALTSPS